jgi:hypothetical protein
MSIIKRLLKNIEIQELVFYFVLALLIFPILSNDWFVTGDGPCHMYNAKILGDLATNRNTSFYLDYYRLNLSLAPNIFDHITLGLLQLVFDPKYAEKIFLLLYFLVFSFGARFLIRKINLASDWLSISVMLFAYQTLLVKGFYNFSFSIAISFWVIAQSLQIIQSPKTTYRNLFQLGLSYLGIYFVHPIGFLFTFISLFCMSFVKLIKQISASNANAIANENLKSFGMILLSILPAAGLYVYYFSMYSFSKPLDWQGLLKINSLVCYVTEEIKWSSIISIVIIIFAAVMIVLRWKKKPNLSIGADGLFLSAIVVAVIYLFNNVDEAVMSNERLRFLPYILLLFWFSYFDFAKIGKYIGLTVSLCLMIIFSSYRYMPMKEASLWVEDFMLCRDKIKPQSTLLTINNDYNGTNKNGGIISTTNWPFIHATNYLGCYTPLILADNYQAHVPYFPLNWRNDSICFYWSTQVDTKNFESRPPQVDFLNYSAKSGMKPIDYILTIGIKANDTAFVNIYKQLQTYRLVYNSPYKHCQLYELKPQ